MVAAQAKRDLYMALITASSRILDSELREEFEHENTQIKVKYLHVEPNVEVTESAIESYYTEHAEEYFAEPKISAVVVPFSLKGEHPALVRELVEQARGGADFGELAREHSRASSRVEGGSLGWIAKSATLPSFRAPMFELSVG